MKPFLIVFNRDYNIVIIIFEIIFNIELIFKDYFLLLNNYGIKK